MFAWKDKPAKVLKMLQQSYACMIVVSPLCVCFKHYCSEYVNVKVKVKVKVKL